jgi:predicted GNAT superfamily acetyltransferase
MLMARTERKHGEDRNRPAKGPDMSYIAPPLGDQTREGTVPASAHQGVTEAAAAAAERDARQAATRAQVEIVEPHSESATRLIAAAGDRVWGPRGTLAPNELRALMHAGDPLHLALDCTRTDRPVVGFAVGFLGWSPFLHVHSHQVGVVDGQRRRGIGYALKLAQRHTCLSHGLTDMRWTFDPLVRRNVAFNLGVLGARAASFHVDFYGAMHDAINGGDASDRLEAVWSLARPLPPRPSAGTPTLAPRPDGDPVTLITERDGWPQLTGNDPAPGALLAVPTDYENLRRHDPARSSAWRAASRKVLAAAYGTGLRIGRVTDAGYQLVSEDEAQ